MKIKSINFLKRNIIFRVFIIMLLNITIAKVSLAENNKKYKISVYGLKSIGVSQSIAESLQEHLESNLLQFPQYNVLSRNNIDIILKETKFQQTGICMEDDCLMKASKLVGVEKIITGTISKVGSTYNFVLKLIDVETAALESSINHKHTGNIDTLLDVVERSLGMLIGKEKHKDYMINKKEVQFRKNQQQIEHLTNELEKMKEKNEAIVKKRNDSLILQSHQNAKTNTKVSQKSGENYIQLSNKDTSYFELNSNFENKINKNFSIEKEINTKNRKKKGKIISIGAIVIFGLIGTLIMANQITSSN